MMGQTIWRMIKLVTVEPVLFFYMLLIFLESNSLQNLIYVKSCLMSHNSSSPINMSDCSHHHKKDEYTDIATYWVRFNGAVLFFFTLLSSFFIASWSDKFGRKFSMIIPPVGTIIAASINCVLSVFIFTDISYLFISSAISGITFGTVGIVAATFGFVTDISEESARTKRMVILEAMIFTGGTLGIYIAGQFLKNADYNLQINGFTKLFLFEISVAAFIVIYIFVRIPRNSSDTELTPISCGSLFKFDHVKDSVKTVFRSRLSGKRKTILLLLLALFFIYLGLVVQFTIAYYYLIVVDADYWKFEQYSTYNSAQFAVEGSALLLGLPIMFRVLHMSDHAIAVLGIVSKICGYIMFGLSTNTVMVYSCIALFIFSEYPVPAIRSMLSKTVDSDEKGKIFAFTTILQNLCFLLGTVALTSIFQATKSFFPGMCFEIVAGMQFLALCIIIYLYVTKEEVITHYDIMENDDGSVEESCWVATSTDSINN